MKEIVSLFIFLLVVSCNQPSEKVRSYDDVIDKATSPVSYVLNKLNIYDLIVFDDAVHSAREPFLFYADLLKSSALPRNMKYIFLEVIPVNLQPYINAYLSSPTKDSSLLIKVFQDDYSGYGWRYQTYLDLFSTIWDINEGKPDSAKINVIALSPPVYWEAIHSREDYDIFQNSLTARDFFMYKTILQKLENFTEGQKGLFLTNTRHAYKNISDSTGKLYWNTNTFFNQRNPGKSFSIRFYNVFLSINKITKNDTARGTTEGLDEYEYNWILPENGAWDSAFLKHGKRAAGFDLQNNRFGQSAYIGNHMLNVKKGTTMYDAYDGVIYQGPVSELTLSGQMGFIYPPAFKTELKRRVTLIEGSNLTQVLKDNQAATLDDFITAITAYKPVSKNQLLKPE